MKKFLLGSVLLGVVMAPLLWAEEVPYDRYAPARSEDSLSEESSGNSRSLQSFGKHFLVYPFELIRRPVDRTLVFLEDYHVYDKANWVYEQMKNRGAEPKVLSFALSGEDRLGGGIDLDFTRLTGLKEHSPDTTLKASGFWSIDHITDYQAKFNQERIGGTGLFAGGQFQYETRGDEHFYGIGPNTSAGDETSYRMERTALILPVGYEFSSSLKAQGQFAYENVNITNGENGRLGIIDNIFVATGRQNIPGLAGDELLSWGLDLEHDNRDDKELPTRGGYERLHFSYHKGLESNSGFFKYRAEGARYFKLFSDRQILAFRGLIEQNNETRHREVPFFDRSRLGGYGIYPRLGDTHRGFRRDRFYDESLLLFNLEYRWVTWEHREWRMDSVLFWDEGQVFGDWNEFQLKDFNASYGIAFRVSVEGEVLITFEVARSREGVQLYAKTKTPF